MTHPRKHHAKTASATRGRLRIRFDRSSRDQALLERVKHHLSTQNGIDGIDANPGTGSMTIRYDESQQSKASLFHLLDDLDVVMDVAVHASDSGGAGGSTGKNLAGAIDDLSAWMRHKTGVRANLRNWLPLGLAGAGVWSLAREGPMIESVPGWVFLWLALDVFVKLHPEQAAHRAPPSAQD
jgi:hypothetical protein